MLEKIGRILRLFEGTELTSAPRETHILKYVAREMNRYSNFFWMLLFLGACSNIANDHLGDGHIIKRSFYEDGSVKIEQTFINDSIKDGFYKKYYPNGQVEHEIEFKNGKKNGQELTYYRNGSIESRSTCVNDKRDGKMTWYYKNGLDSAKLNYFDDNLVGESFDYYPSSKLQHYMVFGFDGKLVFVIKYFENGKIDTIKGKGVVDISINGKEFNLGDTLRGIFIIATPPQSKSNFYIIEDLRYPNFKIELPIEQSCSCVRYNRVLTKRGRINWGGHLYVKLNDSQELSYPFSGTSIVK